MKPILESIQGVRNYILVDLKEAPPRLLGYVASRLKDQFNVPVIVIGRRSKNQVAAEIRAPKGFDSLDLLNELGDLFISYGGHKPASGFSMDVSHLPEFIEGVEAYFRRLKERGEIVQEVDLVLDEAELDKKLLRQLRELADRGFTITFKINLRDLSKLRKFSLPTFDKLKGESILYEVSPQGFRLIGGN
jgi:single-stranded DNA-specific DHH superfamily exonuclease